MQLLLLWLFFFVAVIIMSQDTATTTTPSLMVCSSVSSVTTTVMMPCLGSTCSFSSAGCGSATTADGMGHKVCCWPCHCAEATTSVQMPFQAYAIYAMGPSDVKFLIQS